MPPSTASRRSRALNACSTPRAETVRGPPFRGVGGVLFVWRYSYTGKWEVTIISRYSLYTYQTVATKYSEPSKYRVFATRVICLCGREIALVNM